MLYITTIILTYNEKKHIQRCLENALKFSKKVYVIDSTSTDHTQDICKDYENVEVIVHKYPGNQAAQFNWALENIKIDTAWVCRLDADEYLSDELILEMHNKLPKLPKDVTGIVIPRDVIFMNTRIRHGKLKTVKLLRLWRTGKGTIENRLMDEHTILTEGHAVEFKNYFYDENLNGIDSWIVKHLDYANREVITYSKISQAENVETLVIEDRNKKKGKYYSLPPFHRAFWFFIFRYIIMGGFLDGKAGFVWAFMQCWWYRTLVDVKLQEKLDNKQQEVEVNGKQ